MKNRKNQNHSPRKPGAPIFTYFSQCCNAPATKPACVAVSAKGAETQGLGSWRCGNCNKPCVCNRQKNSVDKTASEK